MRYLLTGMILVLAAAMAFPQETGSAAPENRIFFRLPSHVEAKQSTMQELSGTLAMPTRHLVLDRTGLKGVYDFTLDWPEKSSDAVASISTALAEQLGLELSSKTEPVEPLVIDHAEELTGD